MYIVNDDIPLGCIYEGENGKTKYCPMLNHDDHDDVPYCQCLEDDEAAIGIDERPVYCPIVEFPYADVPDTNVGDMISRQAAIDKFEPWLKVEGYSEGELNMLKAVLYELRFLPTAEPLTDKEQRIFLAAMGREEKVCKEVDRNYVHEPYEDSLVRTCHEITRKVKVRYGLNQQTGGD